MTSRTKPCRSSPIALLMAAALAMLAMGCQPAEENTPSAPAPQAACPTAARGPDPATPGGVALDASKLIGDTRLPDLAGDARPLRDRMGSKGLLVVFVDTSCPFSATAIREMSSVASVLAKHEIPSVLLNVGEPQATVEQFYTQRQVGIPVVYDTGKATLAAWAVTSTPTVFLMDAGSAVAYRGNAVWADVGAAAEKSLGLAAGSLKFTVKGTAFV